LLIMIFFPMLDLISMGVAYGSCMFLNSAQVKQAALIPSADAQSTTGIVKKTLVDVWLSQGLGRFVKIAAYPKTDVSYRDGETDPTTHIKDKIVRVNTTFSCNPFITVPAPPILGIPGLSAPMTF